MTKELAEKIIATNLGNYADQFGVVLVGIRGRGVSGNENQRGKFNDELALRSSDEPRTIQKQIERA